MTSAIASDPIGNLGYLADHPHDFYRILAVLGGLLVGDDEGSINPFAWFRMFETGKGTRR